MGYVAFFFVLVNFYTVPLYLLRDVFMTFMYVNTLFFIFIFQFTVVVVHTVTPNLVLESFNISLGKASIIV